jgi:hypothetical protein
MNKKTFIRVLIALIIVVAIASVVAYLIISPTKPWLAFFIVCCGGVVVFNFLVSLFLVNKNFKK